MSAEKTERNKLIAEQIKKGKTYDEVKEMFGLKAKSTVADIFYRVTGRQRILKPSRPKDRELQSLHTKKYQSNPENRLKINARRSVGYRVKRGLIEKGPCKVCGELKTEAHHESYDKPLEIVWLCKKHHKHSKNRSFGVIHSFVK